MRVGLDVLMEDARILDRLREQRVGVLAHPASVTRELVHVVDALRACEVMPRVLFGPEHGYGGGAQDMAAVDDAPAKTDTASDLRVVSLYGDSFERLSPRADELSEIDLLVIDLQDVGSRYYTFVWTALLALRACAKANVRVLLLDRPNPIDGVTIEGAPHFDARLRSFVGLEAVAIRHGKTYGEIVAKYGKEDGIDAALEVIAVEGWDRTRYGDMWDRPFVMPSPNMPSVETAIVYPGGCLVEATNLSEGRGTTRPFEIVGAPWIDGDRLARDLHASGLGGFRARPLTFLPTFQKHAGVACGGVQLHVTDRRKFQPIATYLALLTFARSQRPDLFSLRKEPYEFVDPSEAEALDLLCGTTATRQALMSDATARDVIATVCR